MISVFVKVDGKLQRYETPYANNEAIDVVESLRMDVQGATPAKSKKHKVSPVFALIDSMEHKNEQLAFSF
jgi:cephalosporin hydroxylase